MGEVAGEGEDEDEGQRRLGKAEVERLKDGGQRRTREVEEGEVAR